MGQGASIGPGVDIQNRGGERFRRLLRKIVAGIRHHAVFMASGEVLPVRLSAARRRDAVRVPFEGDRRHGDRRHGGQAALHVVEAGIAIDQPETVPIRMNHDVDEIRIVERLMTKAAYNLPPKGHNAHLAGGD